MSPLCILNCLSFSFALHQRIVGSRLNILYTHTHTHTHLLSTYHDTPEEGGQSDRVSIFCAHTHIYAMYVRVCVCVCVCVCRILRLYPSMPHLKMKSNIDGGQYHIIYISYINIILYTYHISYTYVSYHISYCIYVRII